MTPQDIIKSRSVGIMAYGGSINQLEARIVEYKDLDICWAGLGAFPIMETHILSKIGKQLDIVFDCATVCDSKRKDYELNVRFPRLRNFLTRPNRNLWITTHGLVRDSIKVYDPTMQDFAQRTFLVDELFPKNQIGFWMDVPNSVTLLIACALAGGANKIFLFGLDGHVGDTADGLQQCYQHEEVAAERVAALGTTEDPGITRDTGYFESRFPVILDNYRRLFGNHAPIYNVSPNSAFTIIKKVSYDDVVGLL